MDGEQPDADLRERIAQLEDENAALRDRLQASPSVPALGEDQKPHLRSRWWTALATVFIVLGCLLAPLAVISGWAKATLTDTDAFVARFAPLADSPQVQSFVIDKAVATIDENVDIEQLTTDVIDGIKALGTRPRASAALDALKGPAASGIETLIRNGVTSFVTSDAFAQTWERTLRISHTQLLATLRNDPQAILAAQSDGALAIQLGPIIEDAKAALLARNITIASRIPAINKTIPIAQSDQISTIQNAYRVVIAFGSWLPWVVLILLTAGVLVARRRSVALVWAAVGLAISMLLLVLGFAIGRAVLLTAVPTSAIPGNVTTLLYDTATVEMKDTAIAGLVLAIAIATVAWLAGPFRAPRTLRGFYADGVASLRHNAEQHGLTTGRVGGWVYGQRRVLHLIIGLGAAAAIILIRPLSLSDLVWTLVITVIALMVVSLVERPEPSSQAEPLGQAVAA